MAGLYPNVALTVSPRMLRTAREHNALIHITSVNFPRGEGRSKYGRVRREDIVERGTTIYVYDQAAAARQ